MMKGHTETRLTDMVSTLEICLVDVCLDEGKSIETLDL